MNYLFFAWLASFIYGLEVVIGKLTSKYTISNPWLLNFVWSLLIIILIIPFALAHHVAAPTLTLNLFWAGFYYALANIFYIISLKLMDVTALGPLFNFRSVFSVLLGVLILGEKINSYQTILIAVIFIAGILVSMDEKLSLKSFFRPAILAVMVFLVSLSLMGIRILPVNIRQSM